MPRLPSDDSELEPAEPKWQRGFAVFEQMLDLEPEDRQAFLDQALADDATLRRAVEELLTVHDQASASEAQGSILDRPVANPLGFRLPEATEEAREVEEAEPGQTQTWVAATSHSADSMTDREIVGPYQLIRQIGQGGMSTVYLAARRDDAFRRPMVIKLVRRDLESPLMLRRLKVERQILAALEHPYIARLYDGGSTEDGLPYFVMEYVEGQPIDIYCNLNRLTLSERLDLFRKVCEAVHYAHQNLVVHRDIKPANILVTTQGDPKLMDFGIAKVLNPGLASQDVELTAPWQRLLTPSFASPEQIRGGTITTISDVYSLGVLLYFLLTGRLPRVFEGRTLQEIEHLLTETEPVKPSRAAQVTSAGESEADTDRSCKNPCANPGPENGDATLNSADSSSAVNERLSDDVDAIVLKALRTVPSQRYGSVERFSEDIERYQAGFPVTARAGTARYRAGKFLRRHRTGVLIGVAVVTTLVFLIGAALIQSRHVAFERDKKARVVAVIQQIFEHSDPTLAPGSVSTLRQALEGSLPMLSSGLEDQPEVLAELMHTTGSILFSLGAHEQAAQQLDQALTIRKSVLGDSHIEVGQTTRMLAAARRELIELEEAEELALRAVEIFRRRLGPTHPEVAEPLIELISVYCYQQQYESAEPLAEEVLRLTRQVPNENRLKVAALEYLSAVHSSRGQYDQAVNYNRRALTLSRRLFGSTFPPQIKTLGNLGTQLRRTGNLEQAESTLREAIELRQQIFGDRYQDPALLNNLAGVHFAAHRYAQAEEYYRQALDVVRQRRGEENWMTFSLGLRIARSRIYQGEGVEAEAQVRELLIVPWISDEHWMRAEAQGVLGEALSAQGRCSEAEMELTQSFQTLLKKNRRARTLEDALERLRVHSERCDLAEDLSTFETMLNSTKAEST